MLTKTKNRLVFMMLLLIVIAAVVVCVILFKQNINVNFGLLYSAKFAETHNIDIGKINEEFANNSSVQFVEKNSDVDSSSVYDETVKLSEQNCDYIVILNADCMDDVLQAAYEYPNVQFCIFNGDEQQAKNYSNCSCFNFAFHELQYVDGYLLGLKLSEMLDNNQITEKEQEIGYIAAKDNAENISAYTAMYLGAKSANKNISFNVKFSDDISNSDRTAKALIANGCKIICQQCENSVVSTVCTENSIYFYGNENKDSDLNIFSQKCNLSSYIKYLIQCKNNKQTIAPWCGGFKDDAFEITMSPNSTFCNNEKIKEKIDNLTKGFSDSAIKVFDTDTWTVSGMKIDTTVSDDDYGSEYINSGGYFAEGEISPNPQFAFKIDGITVLN